MPCAPLVIPVKSFELTPVYVIISWSTKIVPPVPEKPVALVSVILVPEPPVPFDHLTMHHLV